MDAMNGSFAVSTDDEHFAAELKLPVQPE